MAKVRIPVSVDFLTFVDLGILVKPARAIATRSPHVLARLASLFIRAHIQMSDDPVFISTHDVRIPEIYRDFNPLTLYTHAATVSDAFCGWPRDSDK